MPMDNVVVVALFCAFLGLVALFVLWPNEKHGRRVLHRWGITDPTHVEIETATRYLKRRRLWYPWLYFALVFLADLTGYWPRADATWTIPLSVLIGTMLAEVLALHPVTGPLRSASLRTRRLADLAPLWSLIALPVMTAAAMVIGFGTLTDPGWAVDGRFPPPQPWVLIGTAALSASVVAVVLFAALRRPTEEPERADAALRIRSARVAIGLCLASVGASVAGQYGGPYSIAFIAGIVCWVFVVIRPRRRVPSLA